MKVALLTNNAGPGGVVNVVWQLARGLTARGHRASVLCDGGAELVQLERLGIPHVPLPFNRKWKDVLPARQALLRFLKAHDPDIVHCHSRWPSIVCSLAGRRPEVSSLHADRLTAHASRLDRGLLRRLVSIWGRRVTTLDEATRRMLIREQGLRPDRVVVVGNGVDTRRFQPPSAQTRARARQALRLAEEDAVAVFVGALESHKGPDRAVRALARAHARGAHAARLVLCGDGDMLQELQALAAALGVDGHCRFLGWTDPLQAYHAGSFLILPSWAEGFGLVCVEAMLCGLPVLRTRCGGSDQQILEGKTGWATDVGDDAALCERFFRAAQDGAETRRCGEAARAHALAHFSEEDFLDAMIRVYEAAASERRA